MEDRKDKCAVGFDHVEQLAKHSSQVDYSKGFGGKYGTAVEVAPPATLQSLAAQTNGNKTSPPKTTTTPSTPATATASARDGQPGRVGTNYEPTRVSVKADIKGLKNRFESSGNDDEAKKRAEMIREQRLEKEKTEKELELVIFHSFLITFDLLAY